MPNDASALHVLLLTPSRVFFWYTGTESSGPVHCGSQNSSGDPRCNTCTPSIPTFCTQCCPSDFTEEFYAEHPESWPAHPAVFLTQMSTVDSNADLCAAKNYYNTLAAHGVKTELVLVPPRHRFGAHSCICAVSLAQQRYKALTISPLK